ncbi:hypothetical protein FOCC_FOCC000301 [Frankliniella occidentalis]|uniref:Uncharacterized protein LOC113210730 n=1 Tax=Frankliniella occidentalis TaxID=133901 RepID=A0A6J1SZ50_FRAOC|nr:uncharacterized protein LOC113210730 [Frankliniella occidentalis]KAE8752956.1 hypothetical protein FOCC_FOCC000301 [Frankliniella occidentalis]
MAFKTFFAAVALACLSVAIASPGGQLSAACSSRTTENINKQIESCTKDLPSWRFWQPAVACASEITYFMGNAVTCTLGDLVQKLGVCLQRQAVESEKSKACFQLALVNGAL